MGTLSLGLDVELFKFEVLANYKHYNSIALSSGASSLSLKISHNMSNNYNKYDFFQNQLSDSIYFVTRSGLYYLDEKLDGQNLNYSVRSYAVFNDEKNKILWIGSSTGLETFKNKTFS